MMLTAERRNKNASKTPIDWDLNVFCPEQYDGVDTTWDHDLWKINARIYTIGGEEAMLDTHYDLTLLEKESKALGLIDFAYDGEDIFDDWLDSGLDGFISLGYFKEMYWSMCSDRIKEYLDSLPKYIEDCPTYMRY